MGLAIVLLYTISMTLIMIFSLVQMDLSLRYIKQRKRNGKDSKMKVKKLSSFPMVTIQLPVYNERYVIRRLIQAVIDFDYPEDKLEIQILDDSTDDTTQIIKNMIDEIKHKEIQIYLLHRDDRKGYKAGALLQGLQRAQGEYIAIFDADFIPEPDFLLKTLPYFDTEDTGMVQTRWGHINENFSLLTQLQAFGLNAHFSVEQVGRSSAGSFINFNGTAGVWRKSCITDSGGWELDTLSEDLDLSYRAQLKGWKFKYLEEVISPAELPIILPAIRSQQYRWTKGGAETARKILKELFQTPLRLTNKIHAFSHLLNTSIFPLILLAAISSIPMLFIKKTNPSYNLIFNIGSVFLIGFIAISIFYWVSSKYNHPNKPVRYFLFHYPLFLSMSMGLSFQNTLAVIEGFIGKKSAFIRTPKFNISSRQDNLKNRTYYQRKFSWTLIFEMVLFTYFIFGIGAGIYFGDFGLIIFHLMLAMGFAGILFYSFKPELSNGTKNQA